MQVNSDYLRLYPGMTKDNLKTQARHKTLTRLSVCALVNIG